MAGKTTPKARFKNVPGTFVECKSGRYMAFYETRPDIVASGDNEVEARRNLRELYDMVLKHEKEADEKEKDDTELLKNFKTKKFVEKLPNK
jgi:predicted RNase H-like HicB family nuclease